MWIHACLQQSGRGKCWVIGRRTLALSALSDFSVCWFFGRGGSLCSFAVLEETGRKHTRRAEKKTTCREERVCAKFWNWLRDSKVKNQGKWCDIALPARFYCLPFVLFSSLIFSVFATFSVSFVSAFRLLPEKLQDLRLQEEGFLPSSCANGRQNPEWRELKLFSTPHWEISLWNYSLIWCLSLLITSSIWRIRVSTTVRFFWLDSLMPYCLLLFTGIHFHRVIAVWILSIFFHSSSSSWFFCLLVFAFCSLPRVSWIRSVSYAQLLLHVAT